MDLVCAVCVVFCVCCVLCVFCVWCVCGCVCGVLCVLCVGRVVCGEGVLRSRGSSGPRPLERLSRRPRSSRGSQGGGRGAFPGAQDRVQRGGPRPRLVFSNQLFLSCALL